MKRIMISVLILALVFTRAESQVGIGSTTSPGTVNTTITPALTSDVFIGYAVGTTSSGYNTVLGAGADGPAASTTTLSDATYIGYRAGYYGGTSATPTSGDNTFIGYAAGYIGAALATSFGVNNCFIGSLAGQNYAGGSDNTVIGYQSAENFNGGYNTFIGDGIGLTFPYITSNGVYIGQGATLGSHDSYDVVIGYGASIDSCTTSIAIGSQSSIGYAAQEASAMGYMASIGHNTTYSQAIGSNASIGDTCYYCNALGVGASVPKNLKYSTALGSGATVTTNYSIVLGRCGASTYSYENIGVGTTSPSDKLHLDLLGTGSSQQYFRIDGLIKQSTTPTKVLVWDTTDNDRVKWAYATVGAENGTSLDANSKVELGQDTCPTTATNNPAKLLSNRYIPLNNHDVLFMDGPTAIPTGGPQGRVGIGVCTPGAKLDIYRPQVTEEVNPIGLQVINNDLSTNTTDGEVIGVNASVTSTSGPISIGGMFTAADATKYTVGVYSTANCSASVGEAYGGFFSATSTSVNAVSFGIWSQASGNGTNWAGYFDGDVYTTGSYLPSDEKLKTNVTSYTDAMSRLKNIKTHTYSYQTDQYKEMNLPEGQQTGFLANEFYQSFPELTKDAKFFYKDKTKEPLTYKTINYTGLIPYLVEALQELDAKQAQNDTLAQQVASLQSQLNDICNSGCAALKGNSTNTDNGTQPDNKLLQNVPNPFSQQTTIGYILNTGTTAYMNINGLDGKLIKHIALAINGAGSVTVNSNEMAPGTYTYTLNVDGNVIDTKIMVITAQD